MSGVLLQCNKTVEHNELDVVVTLLDDQLDVTAGSCLQTAHNHGSLIELAYNPKYMDLTKK